MNEELEQQLVTAGTGGNAPNWEVSSLLDIPLQVSIEVGRLKLTVQDFLRLSPGSVLEIKKIAGEPFEVAINGRLVARGEVVMVEKSSGVRIVDVFKSAVTP
jgi:flagellar motor switch protein FliN/FliY